MLHVAKIGTERQYGGYGFPVHAKMRVLKCRHE
jgi:hypothetical protein